MIRYVDKTPEAEPHKGMIHLRMESGGEPVDVILTAYSAGMAATRIREAITQLMDDTATVVPFEQKG